MDLYQELMELVDTLNAAGVGYAVCGGIAVAIHGYPRFTRDIDILIRDGDLARVLEAVRTTGFILPALPMVFDEGKATERRVQRVSKAEEGDLLTLDLVLVTPVLEETWQSREQYDWQGRPIHVVSREGLARMKRLAGRDQDLLDLKKLAELERGGE